MTSATPAPLPPPPMPAPTPEETLPETHEPEIDGTATEGPAAT
jgi:hypothetical protein